MNELEDTRDPVRFFNALGGLHDTSIDTINFEPDKCLLTIGIDDLYANFEGLPEYPGLKKCTLIFSEIDSLFLDLETSEGASFSGHSIRPIEKLFHLQFDMRYGGGELTRGRGSISLKFGRLEIAP